MRGPRLAVVLLSSVVVVAGCGPSYPDEGKDFAHQFADRVCGPGNWTAKDASSQPFGGSVLFGYRVTCLKSPGITKDQFASVLSAEVGGPTSDIEILEADPPSLFGVRASTVSDSRWDHIELYDLSPDPKAQAKYGGEGPQIVLDLIP